MRFRKGQQVKFKYNGGITHGVIEMCRGFDMMVYVDSWPCGHGHHRDDKCYWIGKSELMPVRTPRTRIDKMVNAYCEAEFKQMGISR